MANRSRQKEWTIGEVRMQDLLSKSQRTENAGQMTRIRVRLFFCPDLKETRFCIRISNYD